MNSSYLGVDLGLWQVRNTVNKVILPDFNLISVNDHLCPSPASKPNEQCRLRNLQPGKSHCPRKQVLWRKMRKGMLTLSRPCTLLNLGLGLLRRGKLNNKSDSKVLGERPTSGKS